MRTRNFRFENGSGPVPKARTGSILRGGHTMIWTKRISKLGFEVTSMFSMARIVAPCLGLALLATLPASGQSGYTAEGGEYPLAGSLLGDQMNPDVALGTNGGYVVWSDNITDGMGL